MADYIKTLRNSRLIAEIIDGFIIVGFFSLLVQTGMPKWIWIIEFDSGIPFLSLTLPSIGFLLLCFCIFFKDLLFGNASLGKRIMGIIILDDKWQVPTKVKILKRGTMKTFMSLFVYSKMSVSGGNFEGWELSRMGMRVVLKSTFEELKQEALDMNGSFEDNMDILYYKLLEKQT